MKIDQFGKQHRVKHLSVLTLGLLSQCRYKSTVCLKLQAGPDCIFENRTSGSAKCFGESNSDVKLSWSLGLTSLENADALDLASNCHKQLIPTGTFGTFKRQWKARRLYGCHWCHAESSTIIPSASFLGQLCQWPYESVMPRIGRRLTAYLLHLDEWKLLDRF
jgi:hypothetical protein